MSPTGTDQGWYPDPGGSGGERWWDGQAWTEHVRPSAQADVPPAYAMPPAADVDAFPADWYDDPNGSGGERWWDGHAWTNLTREFVAGQPAQRGNPAGWYPDPDGSGAQRWWDGQQWTLQRLPATPHARNQWLQSIRDTGAGQVQQGWVAGIAIMVAGVALFVSTFMPWGSTTLAGYEVSINGFGRVTVSGPDDALTSFMTQQLQAQVESAAQSPGLWAALAGVIAVVAGAAFVWTAWRSHSAIAVTVLGGIAFLVCIGNLINVAAMMGNTASYAGDYTVGFGLLLACALTFALTGLGITAFVLERISIGSW